MSDATPQGPESPPETSAAAPPNTPPPPVGTALAASEPEDAPNGRARGDKPPGERDRVKKTAAEKRKEALDLRVAGMTYRQIAERFKKTYGDNGDAGSIHRMVKGELAAIPRESAKELLEVELETLATMQSGLWRQARSWDAFAIGRVLQIMDHRAKLTGLYKPAPEDSTPELTAGLLGFLGLSREYADRLKRPDEPGEIVVEPADQEPETAPAADDGDEQHGTAA
jgi:hypothetical protein